MLRLILGGRRRRTTVPAADESLDSSSDADVTSNPSQMEIENNPDDDDELEPWADWIRRTTHQAEDCLAALKVEMWVVKARRMKWQWAQKLLFQAPLDRWSVRILQWDPEIHFDGMISRALRRPGRQRTRWTCDFMKFADTTGCEHSTWAHISKTTEFWDENETCFANSAVIKSS